jgi:murein DD-endopeptidase MepM/ murein hydrolase activator NlpD
MNYYAAKLISFRVFVIAAVVLLPGWPVGAWAMRIPPQVLSRALSARIPPRPLGGERLADPVSPACVSSPFGPRILPGRPAAGTFHNGIDLPAPAGAPIRAIAPGVVIRVERREPGGLQVLVQHPGFIGIYSHFGRVAPVIAEGGRAVYRGEKLGVVGHSGVMYGMHLFFGMIVDGRAVNPAPYLDVPLCAAAHRTRADMLAADGKLPPTRKIALAR